MTHLQRIANTSFACALAVLVLICTPGAAQANLLRNPMFMDAGSAGIAKEWQDNSNWADVDVTYRIEPESIPAGVAQVIDCTRFGSGAIQFGQTGIPIHKGAPYTLTIWMKGDLDKTVQLMMRKRHKPYTRYALATTRVSREWQKYSFTMIPSESDDNVFFMIRFGEKGALHVADASLEVGSGDDTASTAKGNLVPNGSFETGLDKWGFVATSPGGDDVRNTRGIDFINFHQPVPEITEKEAFHGARSFTVETPDGFTGVMTTPFITLTPGKQYELSARFRASPRNPVSIQIAAGPHGNIKKSRKADKVSGQWGELSLDFTAEAVPGQAYFVSLRLANGGRFWVDDVVLREKDDTAPTSPDVGVAIDDMILNPGQQAQIKVSTFDERGGSGRLTLKVADFQGKETPVASKDVSLQPGKPVDMTFPHASGETGYYRYIADLDLGQGRTGHSEKALVVVPPADPVDPASPFGTHFFISPQSIKDARDLGADWLRLNPQFMNRWSKIETTKTIFEFYDEPITAAREQGLRVLGLLYRTPRWASEAPPDERGHWQRGYQSYPAKNLEDWGNYVNRIVTRYKGVVDAWEVWNEPDADYFTVLGGRSEKPERYAQLLETAYAEAKKADPNVTVVGGSGTLFPHTRWAGSIFEHGALQHMDALSFHHYTGGISGDRNDTTTAQIISDLRALMRKHGREIPIWETESGLLQPKSGYTHINIVSNKYQAPVSDAPGYFVRNMAHLLAGGAAKWFYYGMFVSGRIDFNGPTSVFEWDGSPRPLAAAYAVMAHQLHGATFAERTEPAPGIVSVAFNKGGSRVEVVWSQKGQTSLSLQGATAVYDVMGRELPAGGQIEVGDDPVYVVRGQ